MFLTTIGIILILLAVCFWILCPIRVSQRKRRTAETEGIAASPGQRRRGIRGTAWSVDFSYTVDGRPQTLKAFAPPAPLGINPGKNPGKKVTICYNPANPRDGHVKEFRLLNPLIYMSIGGVLAYIGVVLTVVGVI